MNLIARTLAHAVLLAIPTIGMAQENGEPPLQCSNRIQIQTFYIIAVNEPMQGNLRGANGGNDVNRWLDNHPIEVMEMKQTTLEGGSVVLTFLYHPCVRGEHSNGR